VFVFRSLCALSVLLIFTGTVAADAPPTDKAQIQAAKGWFGIGLEAADQAEYDVLGLKRPVPRVTQVFRGSPAQTGGVMSGDFVMTFKGRDVLSTDDLVARVGAEKPGTQVQIKILRKGIKEPIEITVMLGLRPELQALIRNQWKNRTLPDMPLKRVDSNSSEKTLLSVLGENRLTIIDYFATWCIPCKRAVPGIIKILKKYKNSGLGVIAISGEKPALLLTYVKANAAPFPVFADAGGRFRRATLSSVLPTFWLVSRDGTVKEVLFGAGNNDRIEKLVRQHLGLKQE
jgi:thiol-disulfide isomerase/thioredoxin